MKNHKFYITTPLYYVNAKPHIGTLYSTLIADVLARWQKLQGKDVFFLTGTDEHGQKVATAAADAGMQPKAFVDTIVPAFKEMWQRYECHYDKFIRTTDAEHEQAVLFWVAKLQENGDIYKSTYSGWYCVPCETFVTLEKDAAKLCPTCDRDLKEVQEENYFFRLSAYEDRLLKFYEAHPDFISPKERINEVISFVRSGLQDLSISRKGVKWGIPFPGDAEQTIYVWADALLNYVSAVGYAQADPVVQQQFAKWWPAEVQVMAKDIVRFHAVYWPAFLMAAELPLPKKLLVHGYILSGGGKMSKSKGNVVDPAALADAYGVEPVRYYLMRQMSVQQDGHFDVHDLEQRIAADLANNLGNLLNRMLTIALNNGLAVVSSPEAWEPASTALHTRYEDAFRAFWDNMEHYAIHLALGELWKFISEVNAYFNAQEPWKAAKTNPELFAEIIAATCHALQRIAIMAWPVMPQKMDALLAALGCTLRQGENYEVLLRDTHLRGTFTLTMTKEPLFMKPEITKTAEQATTSAQDVQYVDINDVAKVELHVGEILTCEEIEGSDKLYKLTVDFGPHGKRTILSGVRKSLKAEELVGKQGVAVTNLPPRKMLGHQSEGMMLYAKDARGVMGLVTVSMQVENGTKVS